MQGGPQLTNRPRQCMGTRHSWHAPRWPSRLARSVRSSPLPRSLDISCLASFSRIALWGRPAEPNRDRLPHRRWLPLPAQKADRLGLSNYVDHIRGWPSVVAGRRVRSQVTHFQRANGDVPTLVVGSSRALGLLAARRSRDRHGDCRRRIGTPFAGPAASTLARRTCEVVSSPGADIGARSRVARRPGPGGRGRAMAGGTACRIGHGPLATTR